VFETERQAKGVFDLRRADEFEEWPPLFEKSRDTSVRAASNGAEGRNMSPTIGELEALYREHGPRVYALALRATGDSATAEDIVQGSFLKALGAWEKFRGDAQAATWLTRIAINEVRMHMRKSKRSRETTSADVDVLVDAAPSSGRPERDNRAPDELAESAERSRAVRQAFDTLDEDTRVVLTLGPVSGRAHCDIAEVLGITVQAVRGRLYRARLAFKAALARADVVQ
jgi:RNA polymerase sigma-70 factor (ECF subfamily)